MSLSWIFVSQLQNVSAAWSLDRSFWYPTLSIAVLWLLCGSQGGKASGSICSILVGALAASRWKRVCVVVVGRFALCTRGCWLSSLWRRTAADSARESKAISMGGRADSL